MTIPSTNIPQGLKLRLDPQLLPPHQMVADLIARVTRVSVETVEIVEAMKGGKRDAVAAG